MTMIDSDNKKRGRPFGKIYREQPYFPEKVEIVRDMYLADATFREIGEALNMTRMGAYYLFKRWVEPELLREVEEAEENEDEHVTQ